MGRFAAQIELVATLLFLAVFSVLGLSKVKQGGTGIVSTAVGSSVEKNDVAVAELKAQLQELKQKQEQLAQTTA